MLLYFAIIFEMISSLSTSQASSSIISTTISTQYSMSSMMSVIVVHLIFFMIQLLFWCCCYIIYCIIWCTYIQVLGSSWSQVTQYRGLFTKCCSRVHGTRTSAALLSERQFFAEYTVSFSTSASSQALSILVLQKNVAHCFLSWS